jgi:hypothetical protein
MLFEVKSEQKTCGFCLKPMNIGKMFLDVGSQVHGYCCKNCGSFLPFSRQERSKYFYGDWNLKNFSKEKFN